MAPRHFGCVALLAAAACDSGRPAVADSVGVARAFADAVLRAQRGRPFDPGRIAGPGGHGTWQDSAAARLGATLPETLTYEPGLASVVPVELRIRADSAWVRAEWSTCDMDPAGRRPGHSVTWEVDYRFVRVSDTWRAAGDTVQNRSEDFCVIDFRPAKR